MFQNIHGTKFSLTSVKIYPQKIDAGLAFIQRQPYVNC